MDLKPFFLIIWQRKWVIVITTVVTVLVTVAGAFLMAPIYEASTTLRIAAPGGSMANYSDLMYVTQLRNTFSEITTSDVVLDEVAKRLDLDEHPEVTTKMLGNSELMLLTAKNPNPVLAQQVANTAAEVLLDLYSELYVESERNTRELLIAQLSQAEKELTEARDEYERLSSQSSVDPELAQHAAVEFQLKRQTYTTLVEQFETAQLKEALRTETFSVFEPADLPETPAGLPKIAYVALGFVVGLTGGVGLAFLFENLDKRLYTAERIEAVTRAATLGKIPTAGKQWPMAFSNGRYPQEEAFRRLRTNLFALDNSAPLQTLLVTSAEPQEGKTTIVVNLAHMIAESGRQVVAVDCDLRHPTMHIIFGLTNETGVSSLLQQQTTLDAALHGTEVHRLHVLTAGPCPSKPAELLGSPAMTDLISELLQRFDLVLLDTPAITAVADAAILARNANGVLLVVRCAKAREEAVQAACQQLADVNANLIGTVVNRTRQYGHSGYYTDYQLKEAVSARDQLTEIRGIGPVYEEALRAIGISTFRQLADQDAKRLAHSMRAEITAERILRQRWIEQAQKLSRRDIQENHLLSETNPTKTDR